MDCMGILDRTCGNHRDRAGDPQAQKGDKQTREFPSEADQKACAEVIKGYCAGYKRRGKLKGRRAGKGKEERSGE